jgi:hypothetical protein
LSFQLKRVPQTFGAILYALTDVPPFGADKIDHRAHDEHNVWKKAYRTLSSESCGGLLEKRCLYRKKKLPMPPKKSILFEEQKVSSGKGQLFPVLLII